MKFSIFNFQFPKAEKSKSSQGFTLIELLVAMTLFAVLISIAAGSFVRAIRTQRAIVALMEANDNMNSALEQMSRELRVGSEFKDFSGGFGVAFKNAADKDVVYYIEDSAVKRRVGNSSGEKITADSIEVKRLSVSLCGKGVNGSDVKCYGGSSDYPPRITIDLSVAPRNTYFENFSFDIQTTVSARNF
ncbi:MAG: prepilin-type N-terminal cleavage/methylation domain-containing protein [Candidatus Wolfebacteria bacterium]|nr:prepilin-type N-terminal cleavage/methylation domain-containing protein [Candidatus Wolfebacteria bacterium]